MNPLAALDRRSFWQATMPALPDRSTGTLPDSVDVVVVGGGYTGLAAARQLARSGASVVLLEANTLGWGASTRNGGIVHPGYKWGPKALVRRYGDETGRALYRETLDGYALVKQLIADEAIDCDFDECGHLELAYAPSHLRDLEEARDSLAFAGVETALVPPSLLREEIGSDAYFGALAFRESGGLHPGKYLAGLAAAADRAGAHVHEGVRALRVRRQADGRSVVETSRGGVLARDVVVATNGYTDGFVPALRRRIIPIGSYIIVTAVLPGELAAELSPKGRVFFDTKNFLFYWRLTPDRRMLFGGRASFMPTSVHRTARILQRGMAEVHPQLGQTPVEYAWGGKVGFTFDRMPHVGRVGGLTYAMGYCGTGVAMATYLGTRVGEWLGGGSHRRSRACGSRSCRRPTRGGRGSCRSSASGIGSTTGWRRAREGRRGSRDSRGTSLEASGSIRTRSGIDGAVGSIPGMTEALLPPRRIDAAHDHRPVLAGRAAVIAGPPVDRVERVARVADPERADGARRHPAIEAAPKRVPCRERGSGGERSRRERRQGEAQGIGTIGRDGLAAGGRIARLARVAAGRPTGPDPARR